MKFNTNVLVRSYENAIQREGKTSMDSVDKKLGIDAIQRQSFIARWFSWLPWIRNDLEQAVNDAWQIALLNKQAAEVEKKIQSGEFTGDCELLSPDQNAQLKKVSTAVGKVFVSGVDQSQKTAFLREQFTQTPRRELEGKINYLKSKGYTPEDIKGALDKELRDSEKIDLVDLEAIDRSPGYESEESTVREVLEDKLAKEIDVLSYLEDITSLDEISTDSAKEIYENGVPTKNLHFNTVFSRFVVGDSILKALDSVKEGSEEYDFVIEELKKHLNIEKVNAKDVIQEAKKQVQELRQECQAYMNRKGNLVSLLAVQNEPNGSKKDEMLKEAVGSGKIEYSYKIPASLTKYSRILGPDRMLQILDKYVVHEKLADLGYTDEDIAGALKQNLTVEEKIQCSAAGKTGVIAESTKRSAAHRATAMVFFPKGDIEITSIGMSLIKDSTKIDDDKEKTQVIDLLLNFSEQMGQYKSNLLKAGTSDEALDNLKSILMKNGVALLDSKDEVVRNIGANLLSCFLQIPVGNILTVNSAEMSKNLDNWLIEFKEYARLENIILNLRSTDPQQRAAGYNLWVQYYDNKEKILTFEQMKAQLGESVFFEKLAAIFSSTSVDKFGKTLEEFAQFKPSKAIQFLYILKAELAEDDQDFVQTLIDRFKDKNFNLKDLVLRELSRIPIEKIQEVYVEQVSLGWGRNLDIDKFQVQEFVEEFSKIGVGEEEVKNRAIFQLCNNPRLFQELKKYLKELAGEELSKLERNYPERQLPLFAKHDTKEIISTLNQRDKEEKEALEAGLKAFISLIDGVESLEALSSLTEQYITNFWSVDEAPGNLPPIAFLLTKEIILLDELVAITDEKSLRNALKAELLKEKMKDPATAFNDLEFPKNILFLSDLKAELAGTAQEVLVDRLIKKLESSDYLLKIDLKKELVGVSEKVIEKVFDAEIKFDWSESISYETKKLAVTHSDINLEFDQLKSIDEFRKLNCSQSLSILNTKTVASNNLDEFRKLCQFKTKHYSFLNFYMNQMTEEQRERIFTLEERNLFQAIDSFDLLEANFWLLPLVFQDQTKCKTVFNDSLAKSLDRKGEFPPEQLGINLPDLPSGTDNDLLRWEIPTKITYADKEITLERGFKDKTDKERKANYMEFLYKMNNVLTDSQLQHLVFLFNQIYGIEFIGEHAVISMQNLPTADKAAKLLGMMNALKIDKSTLQHKSMRIQVDQSGNIVAYVQIYPSKTVFKKNQSGKETEERINMQGEDVLVKITIGTDSGQTTFTGLELIEKKEANQAIWDESNALAEKGVVE